ncbi:probable APG7 - component of the autophagic system [Pseudozyma flocculosa]|uniref:Ubiquitin-like modifier-activating enzyme ATG7 n=1 Tax=Pseudozyma flocculosa TaxID=84751 RepID=A0A5C3FB75_9BASI|nr:probable APG7 - component of the autophagic system [Pseudozyma flocculosa]
MALIKFAPFGATIHPSFWQQLSSYKIDRLQLSEEPVDVRATYAAGRSILDRQTGQEVHLGCSINVDGSSFLGVGNEQGPDAPSTASHAVAVRGRLKNFNTIEEFKKADKQAAFDEALQDIWQSILHADDPTDKLSSFLVLTFADLKKYRFFYWFAFPALTAKPSWELSLASQLASRHDAGERCDFFLVKRASSSSADAVEVAGVKHFDAFFAGVDEGERIVGLLDPSSNIDAPGWPLRNLLVMLHARYGVSRIKVVRWKDAISAAIPAGGGATLGGGSGAARLSLIGDVVLPKLPESVDGSAGRVVLDGGRTLALASQPDRPDAPAGVGWERNAQGKLGPKVADLGPLMDPARLADQAVDLNLKLMRWRIMPDIKLERIQQTRCLLLGAGTLGCYVARTLLGWGVRHITFVDSSRVSFSNPVRQPLFDFQDCLDGGKPKAQCAADKLKQIYPGVTSEGHTLNIPMPGHPVAPGSVEQVRRDVAQLESLIDGHDVVYLLMDSRESRWLPTVLGAAKSKLVVNAALGFDTYLVMRHGAPPASPSPSAANDRGDEMSKPPSHRRLGCYFCNDVVAPTDSLTDRTLDQMCTVTRPGLAAIAGASAVELMVSTLQHERGMRAPAASSSSSSSPSSSGSGAAADAGQDDTSTVLGVVPHQIRGFLAKFNNLLIVGQAYDRCTGCSAAVVDAYRRDGFDMLLRAFNEDQFLERLTGLDKMYAEADEIEAALDWEEDDEEEEGQEAM